MSTVQITDRILYTQLLTHAGYKVIAITEAMRDRGGSSVVVMGAIERDGERVGRVTVKPVRGVDDRIAIAGVEYRVRLNDDGAFGLEACAEAVEKLDDYGDPIGGR